MNAWPRPPRPPITVQVIRRRSYNVHPAVALALLVGAALVAIIVDAIGSARG